MKIEKAAEEKDYAETLTYLFGLQRFGIKLGLTNITALLRRLGDPHTGLPALHIAGSNGKGSTAAFLSAILFQAGYRVGLYTSPHLVDFGERIQVNGSPIPVERVVYWTRSIRKALEEMGQEGQLWSPAALRSPPHPIDPQKTTITFFEFTTAMAFLHFQDMKVDVAVLEAGMGGRLDATNVIDPLLCLITPISLEHQQYLGKTLLQIAREKAGIIKPRRPLLTSCEQSSVKSLFRRRCRELDSPFYAWGEDFSARELGPRVMDFQGRTSRWRELHLGLYGSHQVANASLSLAAVEVLTELGYSFGEEQVRKGLGEVRWPGRLELIRERPGILLDGAHNPGAARVLKKALQSGFPRRRLIMVLGVMSDKEIGKMMTALIPLADSLILTRPKMDRAASLESLRILSGRFGKPTTEVADVGEALTQAVQEADEEDLILVTGSLYTVGEARAHLVGTGKGFP